MSTSRACKWTLHVVRFKLKFPWTRAAKKKKTTLSVRPESVTTVLHKYDDQNDSAMTDCGSSRLSRCSNSTTAADFIVVTPGKRKGAPSVPTTQYNCPFENPEKRRSTEYRDQKNVANHTGKHLKISLKHPRPKRWLLFSSRRVFKMQSTYPYFVNPKHAKMSEPCTPQPSPTSSYYSAVSHYESFSCVLSPNFESLPTEQHLASPSFRRTLTKSSDTERSLESRSDDELDMSIRTAGGSQPEAQCLPCTVVIQTSTHVDCTSQPLVATEPIVTSSSPYAEALKIAKECCGRWVTILERSDSLDAQYRLLGLGAMKRAVMNRLAVPLTLFLEENDTILHCWVHTPLGIRHMRSSLIGKELVDDDVDVGTWAGTTQVVDYSIPWFRNGASVRVLQQAKRNPKVGVCVETRCVLPDVQEEKVMFFHIALSPNATRSTPHPKALTASRILRYIGEFTKSS